jgi:hypothetical protein
MRLQFLTLMVSALLFGCGGSDGGASPELPEFFRLEGSASLQAGEQTVDCHIDFIVELAGETARTNAFVEYVGTMGGEAGRQVLNADGSGIELVGDAFSEVRARLTFPDQVVIEAINLPPFVAHDPPSFFEELIRFEGRLGVAELISGEWLCAPFFTDRGGFEDDTLFAEGLWFTETITN